MGGKIRCPGARRADAVVDIIYVVKVKLTADT